MPAVSASATLSEDKGLEIWVNAYQVGHKGQISAVDFCKNYHGSPHINPESQEHFDKVVDCLISEMEKILENERQFNKNKVARQEKGAFDTKN